MNKQHFNDLPNWWLYKPAKQYAGAQGIKLVSTEDYEAAVRNYILFAINKN